MRNEVAWAEMLKWSGADIEHERTDRNGHYMSTVWDPRIRKGILEDQRPDGQMSSRRQLVDNGHKSMNPVAMEKHPKETPTGIVISTSPGQASLASSS